MGKRTVEADLLSIAEYSRDTYWDGSDVAHVKLLIRPLNDIGALYNLNSPNPRVKIKVIFEIEDVE